MTTTTTTTTIWKFNCTNGDWINSQWVCDGNNDCNDNSDELNCNLDETYKFNCTDGEWINKKWVCDGYKDCDDNSDEKNCMILQTIPKPVTTVISNINVSQTQCK